MVRGRDDEPCRYETCSVHRRGYPIRPVQITAREKQQIREDWGSGEWTHRELATYYGISTWYVWKIINDGKSHE